MKTSFNTLVKFFIVISIIFISNIGIGNKTYARTFDPSTLTGAALDDWNSESTTPTSPTCTSSQHLESNTCVANVKSCSITNGVGTQTYSNSSWASCVVSTCNAGYTNTSGSCTQIVTTTTPPTSSKTPVEILFAKVNSGAYANTSNGNVKAVQTAINNATKNWTIYKKTAVVKKVLTFLNNRSTLYKNYYTYTYLITYLVNTPTGSIATSINNYDKETQDLFIKVYSPTFK